MLETAVMERLSIPVLAQHDDIDIDDIGIGDRYRKDLGDVAALPKASEAAA